MNKEELITTMGQLGYRLFTPGRKQLSGKKILDLLAELSDTGELRLIEGFPVVLANCARRGIKLDIKSLLSRYEQGQKRINLEKLILISAELLNQEGIETPEGVSEVVEPLRGKYGSLLDLKSLDLDKNRSVAIARLRNTVRRYALDLKRSESAQEKGKKKQLRSFQLSLHLSTLFTPKQKELISKKLDGKPLTKTEKEYFSRVVKKKLMALSDNELRKIASQLIRK